ncbi:MAG: Hsp20/alpha crystallin family protein [Ilumatobacteraceae bacterium]
MTVGHDLTLRSDAAVVRIEADASRRRRARRRAAKGGRSEADRRRPALRRPAGNSFNGDAGGLLRRPRTPRPRTGTHDAAARQPTITLTLLGGHHEALDHRPISLPDGVTADDVKATYDAGVLEVRLPKRAVESHRSTVPITKA